MSSFRRLFGRGVSQAKERAPGAEVTSSPQTEAAGPASAASAAIFAGAGAALGPAGDPATRPDAAQPEVPLRALQRYRQDPAYKNFMAKARKAPGAVSRRPGIPADAFDRQQRPRGT